ncbi:MAG: HEAT repeat domain-containing protein [Verrucomicrobiota bacterium]
MNRNPFTLLTVLCFMTGCPFLHAAKNIKVPAPTNAAIEFTSNESPQQMQQAFTQAMQAILPQLGFQGDNKALEALEAIVHHAARPNAETERLACCQAIAVLLGSEASRDAKYWLMILLNDAGRAEVVPALAKLLESADAAVAEMARRALQKNPAPEAATALRAALAKTTDPVRQAALALALGKRQDTASTSAITALLKHKDEALLNAALAALGDLGTPEAAKAIAGSRQSLPEALRLASAEAWLKCAEQFLRAKQIKEAAAIYQQLYQPQEPRGVRLAALHGTLQAAGDNAGKMILELLTGTDADARTIATGQINDLSSAGAKALVSGVNKLPIASQTLVLGILATKSEKAALPLALELIKSQDETARVAGLNALGWLGDGGHVLLLLQALATQGDSATEARATLTRIVGTGVNESITDAMKQAKDAKLKAVLIEVLEARGATTAVTALLTETVSEDATLRRSAFKALGKLAMPENLPDMVKGLVKTKPGGERDEAEKAIAMTSARVPEKEKQAEAVLQSLATADPAEKLALLPVLGRIGGAKAFDAIKSAVAGSDNATVEAGLKALNNLPDATDEIADQLLMFVKKAQKPAERKNALRAYIRVVSLPDGFSDKQRLQKLKLAMELADQDAERNFVLERLVDVKTMEAMRYAAQFLETPALANRAANTVMDISRERNLRNNRAEIDQLLNRIITNSKEKNIVERAKRRLTEK